MGFLAGPSKETEYANSFLFFLLALFAFKPNFDAFSLFLTPLCMQYCFAM